MVEMLIAIVPVALFAIVSQLPMRRRYPGKRGNPDSGDADFGWGPTGSRFGDTSYDRPDSRGSYEGGSDGSGGD